MFKYEVALIFLISIGTLLCCSGGKVTDQNQMQPNPLLTSIDPVTPEILSLTVTAGTAEYGRQVPSMLEKGDEVFFDENRSTWIKRKDKVIGALVGKEGKVKMTLDRLTGVPLETEWADQRKAICCNPMKILIILKVLPR